MLRAVIFIAIAASLACEPAAAKDFLPIRKGEYVRSGVSCESPAYADLQGYYGDTLSYGHGSCDIVSVRPSRQGLRVLGECQDVDPDISAVKVTTVWKIVTETNVLIDGEPYRWCADNAQKLWK